MSTGKRLAKRSIIGTRVCAPGDDGKYYSGVISAVNTPSNGKHDSTNGALSITPLTRYQVRFDSVPGGSKVPDNKKEFLDRDLIGPGFSNVCGAKLVTGQKVFLTHNGREVQGVVLEHREHHDEVEVSVISPNKENTTSYNTTLTVRIDGVRLMESRKSARLADVDTDFARLADVGSDRKRTASQAIDRPDNSNSPYHINNNNNRCPNWKPRRRTHSEQSSTDNSENNLTEPARRTYKNNNNDSTAYYGDYTYRLHLEQANSCGSVENMPSADTTAAMALMSLSSPGKENNNQKSEKLQCRMEESTSSGNSNASDSENSWRSDSPPSLRSSEENYGVHHQQSSSAPNSPKDEGIVPDLLYPHRYNKKRRFLNVPAEPDSHEEEEQAASRSSPKYVCNQKHQPQPMKPRRDEYIQTTKAKRGRPPTYRRRSPSPVPLPHDDASDGDGEDSNDDTSNSGNNSHGANDDDEEEPDYVDMGKKYICTWRPRSGVPACGVTGNFHYVSVHFMKLHNNNDEDMDFYVLEESEYTERDVEIKPTECSPPTKSHWDMVKPMTADPEYQMQIHRNQMAAHSPDSMANSGREIIYMESPSLSPRADMSPRQNMSPPRAANKPIKARAAQQQRQFFISNNSHNNVINNVNSNSNNHMTKVSLVHINLGKMPQTTRRGRSDVKKCRKVYGMSHKELWCTQCKWKKACQRFHVPQPGGPTATATEISIPEQMNAR